MNENVKRLTAGFLSLPLSLGLILSYPVSVAAAPEIGNYPSAVTDSDGLSGTARTAVPRIRYDYPAGAMAVDLYLDGVPVLGGGCAMIGNTVYVAAERFVGLCGDFDTAYHAGTETLTVTGRNLSLSVRVGEPYITVNGRPLYTGAPVLSLRGWIFAPLSSLVTALNGRVTIRTGWYDAYVTSGDAARVRTAEQVYDPTDLYWLSRIISAEARGEPLEGQIAVGCVVLNRVRSSEFPNTVKGVIFDSTYGIQFSPVANGTVYNTPADSAVLAAKIVLEGYSLSTRALYFYNPAIAASSWIGRTRPYLFTIGGHAFYG